jgi:hypothetical protein
LKGEKDMGLHFHETVRGAKFFDRDLPDLIKAINRLSDELEKNRMLEERKLVEKEIKEEKED